MFGIGIETFNYAEFYIDIDAINEGNSIWLHAENTWVAADPIQSQVDVHIADDRFSRIDGFIPEDAETMDRISHMRNQSGKSYYDPLFFDELAKNLLNEGSLILVFREISTKQWDEYDDYEINSQGSANNYQGQINFYQARPGDYAWAFRTGAVYLENETRRSKFSIYPNPAQEQIRVRGLQTGDTVKIFDANGRQIIETTYAPITIESLRPGQYTLQIIRDLKLTCY
ncbi:MAG: hypothetical protein ACI9RU_000899 [Litorivivens sp.]